MKPHPTTSWKIEYAARTGVVHLVLCGVVTPQYARQLAADALAIATRHHAEKFLIDSRQIEIPLGAVFEVFSLPQTFEKLGFARGNRTAILHRPCPKAPEIFRIFEAGYQSMGFAVRFFTNPEKASAWLKTGKPASPLKPYNPDSNLPVASRLNKNRHSNL